MKKSSIQNKKSLFSIFLCSVLVIFTVILSALLLWALITAVKDDRDFTIGQNYFGLPKDYFKETLLPVWEWKWDNFSTIIKYFTVRGVSRNGKDVAIPFFTQIIYTLLYTGGCSFLAAICPCIIAYARRRYDFIGIRFDF